MGTGIVKYSEWILKGDDDDDGDHNDVVVATTWGQTDSYFILSGQLIS